MCVCVCVCVCVRACVRACVCVYMLHACVQVLEVDKVRRELMVKHESHERLT